VDDCGRRLSRHPRTQLLLFALEILVAFPPADVDVKSAQRFKQLCPEGIINPNMIRTSPGPFANLLCDTPTSQ
jgi:hypothetical protein